MSLTHKVPYYFNNETNSSTWDPPLPDDEIRKLPGAQHLKQQQSNQIRASHLLIKHKDSRRPSSWKEVRDIPATSLSFANAHVPSQTTITRSKEEAIAILRKHQAEIDGAPSKSATFGDLAKVHSDCSSHDKNGDLGQFSRGQMQKPFEEAAFGLQVGEISDIVSTDSGVHLIMRTG